MVAEWKNTRLVDLMRIETGGRNTEDRVDGGKYPFFVRSQQVEHIDDYNYDCESVLTAGDGVGTGKVFHYIDGKFDAHQRVYVMSQFSGIDGKYFFYFFTANFLAEVEKYTAKSSVDSVRRSMIAEMEVPLPPLTEQRAIAAALSDTDACISALEKLITKKCAVKQGAMQELLTGKRRLPGFSGEWAEKALGELCVIKDGTHGTYSRTARGALFLSAKNVFDGGLHIEEESYISEQDYQQIVSNGYPQKGDILLSCVGTIGRCCIYDGTIKAAFQRSVVFIRSNTAYNGFLAYAIKSAPVQSQLIQSANASAQGGVYLGALAKLQLELPPTKAEQTAIASILSDMDAEIDALTARLNKAKYIKQGMMSELLTGRIRLVGTEPANATVEAYVGPGAEPIRNVVEQPIKGHNQQFDDAVMIAGIVNALYSDKFPLGRKKVQKCLYLLRRYQDESTEAFKKKAAGPYADEVRYKGGEPIARSANYIDTTATKQGTTFARGANISQALGYITAWDKQGDIKWVADKLRFKKVDELELLATVDMAICDLTEAGTPVTVQAVKHLIATNVEWKAKLKKQTFSDANIARAIRELQTLLQGGN
jgi:type I restriction enzyme S subunit